MADTLDKLEAVARAADECGEIIGEERWYIPGEVQTFANRGAGGMVAISDADDAHIAAFSPKTALALLAVARAASSMIREYDDLMLLLPGEHPAALRAALEELEKRP